MRMKFLYLFVVILAGVAAALAINSLMSGKKDEKILVESIQLNFETAEINEGETVQLIASILPENATNKELVWISSNNRIVNVSDTGLVTGKSAGDATIFVSTSNGKTVTCEIKVNKISKEELVINKKSTTLNVGKTVQLKISTNSTGKKVTWTSSNPNVATVSSNGLVTAKSVGSTVVTATAGKKTATCKVTISSVEVAPTDIKLNKTSLEIVEENEFQLEATVYPEEANNKTVTWFSDNPKVATITSAGKIKAIAVGTATITAKTNNGKSATCKVTVTKTTVSFNKYINGTKQYEADSNTLKVYITEESISGYGSFYVTSIWADNPRKQLKKAMVKSNSRDSVKNILEKDINNTLTSKIAVGFNASAIPYHRSFDSHYPESTYKEPSALLIYNGKTIFDWRDKGDIDYEPISYINKSNNLSFLYTCCYSTDQERNSAYQTAKDQAYNTIVFGPVLVKDGAKAISDSGLNWDTSSTQHQVLCQVDAHNYRIITSHGGTILLKNLRDLLISRYNCKTAVNLDGGGSTSLLYKEPGTNSFKSLRSGRDNTSMMYFTE